MGRPKVHDEATRKRLLLAAEKLAETEGLAALSLRRVATETGLTTRAVYSTFGSKEALVGALGARCFDWLTEELDRMPATDDAVGDLIDTGAVIFRRLVVEHPVLFYLGFQADIGKFAAEVISAAARDGIGGFVGRVERVVARPEDVRSAVRGLNAMNEGLAAMELRGNFAADQDPAAAWRAALETFVRGLTGGS
jgi:AcrR family transcriptional regulator